MAFSRVIPKSQTVGAEAPAREDLDTLVVQRVKNGEVAAYDILIKKYRERLYGVLYNLTSNREDAADLTQETFIRAFQNIRKFKGNSAFYTWLYRIGVNAAISHLKKARRGRFFSFEQMSDEALGHEVFAKMTQSAQQNRKIHLQELQEKLNEALQSLSLKHRTVVVLFEIEGLSHQEIANITNTSEGTVRSRLHYAKQQLQAKLDRYL